MSAGGAAGRPAEGLTSDVPYVSARGRGHAVVFLFLAFIAVAIFSVFSSALQLGLIAEVLAGGGVTDERVEANDRRQAAAAFVHLVVYVALVVAFLLWLYRVSRNLPALGNEKSRIEYKPGWAVGSFFIPIVNLFMPYKAVREVWEKSDPGIRTPDDVMFTPAASAPLLLGWWLSWVAMNVLGRVTGRFEQEAATPETLRWVTWVEMAGDLVGVLSAVLAILVVRGVTRRQEERAAHVAYVPHTPPPPPLFTPPPPQGPRG